MHLHAKDAVTFGEQQKDPTYCLFATDFLQMFGVLTRHE